MTDIATQLAHGLGGLALGVVIVLLAYRLAALGIARRVLRMPEPAPVTVEFDVDTSGIESGIAAAQDAATALADGPEAPPARCGALHPHGLTCVRNPDHTGRQHADANGRWPAPAGLYVSRAGMRWEDAPPAADGSPSVRLHGGALAWPRDDIARLYGLTPIDAPESEAGAC